LADVEVVAIAEVVVGVVVRFNPSCFYVWQMLQQCADAASEAELVPQRLDRDQLGQYINI